MLAQKSEELKEMLKIEAGIRLIGEWRENVRVNLNDEDDASSSNDLGSSAASTDLLEADLPSNGAPRVIFFSLYLTQLLRW